MEDLGGKKDCKRELWEHHRETIKRLFLDEDTRRKDLPAIMAKFGLHATGKQFKDQLKKWNFRKNNCKQAGPKPTHFKHAGKRANEHILESEPKKPKRNNEPLIASMNDLSNLTHVNSLQSECPAPRNHTSQANPIPKINRAIEVYNSPLHLAALEGRVDEVRQLLERRVCIYMRNRHRDTALHLAARNGHEEVVRLLCVEAVISARNRSRDTALHLAAKNGHEGVVRLLLKLGPPISAQIQAKDPSTPLHLAAESGHESVVELLLNNGMDIEAGADEDIERPLHLAARNGHEAVVRLLLEKGADIEAADGEGDRPLHFAAWRGHEAVVRLLLEKGADIEAADGKGNGPLHFAARSGHEAVVRLLLEKGARRD